MSVMPTRNDRPTGHCRLGTVQQGSIQLNIPTDWPDGTLVEVRLAQPADHDHPIDQPQSAIIAGFGLAGRYAASLFDRKGIQYTVVEQNNRTVEQQARLGKKIIYGDIGDDNILRAAGIETASILVLAIPHDQDVLKATAAAKRLNPDIYIVARTLYASSGLVARSLGADEVVQAERVVANDVFERLTRHFIETADQHAPIPS